MEENNEKPRSQYNVEKLLEDLVKRLNKCDDFTAVVGKPVTETQIVCIPYGMVAETGQYPEDCWVWRSREDKYWTVFQAHFIEAQVDLQERQQTAHQDGYVSNNLVRM